MVENLLNICGALSSIPKTTWAPEFCQSVTIVPKEPNLMMIPISKSGIK